MRLNACLLPLVDYPDSRREMEILAARAPKPPGASARGGGLLFSSLRS